MLDCIIIGSGVAGISAALTLQSMEKRFEIFGSAILSDKVVKAERIHNYPGLSNVTGEEFQKALIAQLKEAEITIKEEKVAGVYALKGKYAVLTQSNNTYESRSVILACGVESVKAIDGETDFVGRGVSYCATCDGFLYKDKTIAIVCTTKQLEHEIEYLADIAKKVYLIPMYKDVAVDKENVEKIMKLPKKIQGGKRVETLLFSDPNEKDGVKTLPIDGVFMLRDSLFPSVLVGGLETQNGHVVVGRDASTNLSGCYAAGDCTGRPYQYAKAVGEGNVAAHSVIAYLKNSAE